MFSRVDVHCSSAIYLRFSRDWLWGHQLQVPTNQLLEVERYVLPVQLEPLRDLVDPPFDFSLEDQSNEDLLHFRFSNVELLGEE